MIISGINPPTWMMENPWIVFWIIDFAVIGTWSLLKFSITQTLLVIFKVIGGLFRWIFG